MADHVYVESRVANRCLFCEGSPEDHTKEIEVKCTVCGLFGFHDPECSYHVVQGESHG